MMERINDRNARLSALRTSAIDRLCADAKRDGKIEDRAYWALVWDLELAPLSTNRAMLEEIGVDARTATLRAVADGLAVVQTYLLHHEHLSDEEVLTKLNDTILDEPVREICPGSGGREFIDLAGGLEPTPEPRPITHPRPWMPRPDEGVSLVDESQAKDGGG